MVTSPVRQEVVEELDWITVAPAVLQDVLQRSRHILDHWGRQTSLLRIGASADRVMLLRYPQADLTHLGSVRLVIRGGKIVYRAR